MGHIDDLATLRQSYMLLASRSTGRMSMRWMNNGKFEVVDIYSLNVKCHKIVCVHFNINKMYNY